MARCMTSERHGRPVFYGAMITEGIVALIWAAAATYFFHENGMEESNASVIVFMEKISSGSSPNKSNNALGNH